MNQIIRIALVATCSCGGEVTTTTDAASYPFSCGDAATCQSASQFCQTVDNGGAQQQVTTTYQCVALPSGCSSCDCLLDAGVVMRCYQAPKCEGANGGSLTTSTNCVL